MSDIIRIRMQWVLLAITLAVSASGWVSVLAADRRLSVEQIHQHEHRLQKLEKAREISESQLVEIRTDVRWIRQELQRRHP
jgi:hypothetical protein